MAQLALIFMLAARALFWAEPAQAGNPPKSSADRGLKSFLGKVAVGHGFQKEIGKNLLFVLTPIKSGWVITVEPKDDKDGRKDYSTFHRPIRWGHDLLISTESTRTDRLHFNFVVNEEEYQKASKAIEKVYWPYNYKDKEVEEATEIAFGEKGRAQATFTITDVNPGQAKKDIGTAVDAISFSVEIKWPKS